MNANYTLRACYRLHYEYDGRSNLTFSIHSEVKIELLERITNVTAFRSRVEIILKKRIL